jgi:transcriptional regulator GlxA family with amidase domain
MTTVVFALVDGVHLLDVAGPAQAFGTAAGHGAGYELVYVADRPVVHSAQGLALHAVTRWPELESDDIVIVPGWRGRSLRDIGKLPDTMLSALRAHQANGGLVASVCAGAEALGQAGLLDGHRCTTHHQHQDELARRYPRATVVPDVLFVDDGDILTSAGVASGIDLALYLIEQRDGSAAAARAAREMVVFARRNGADAQAGAAMRYRTHLSEHVHRAQELIESEFDRPLPLTDVARSLGLSARTLTRHFTRATGLTPLKYQQALRLERAQAMLDAGVSMDTAARSVGFEDARMLRRLRAAAR